MTHLPIRKQISIAIACAFAVGAMSSAMAAEISHADAGYLTDSRGVAVRSGSGLCWNAGSATEANLECDPPAAGPVAAVVAPAPAPIAAVVAPKPVAERVALDADTLFDFDKATLRPAGKEALDAFAAGLKDISPEGITVVGHTDRFGSDAYNQDLSEQRAASVKAYLVSKGVDAGRVSTEGRGETQPTTKAGDCQGAKSKAVVACLQPDRRVEVEISGNRIDRLSQQ